MSLLPILYSTLNLNFDTNWKKDCLKFIPKQTFAPRSDAKLKMDRDIMFEKAEGGDKWYAKST